MWYVFNSLLDAQTLVDSVDSGEGYPKLETLTTTYADILKHFSLDKWAVIRDAITESYYQGNAIEEISNLNDWVEL